MTVTIWGLKNCDTCRKALAWAKDNDLPFHFKDVRKDGLTAEEIARWVEQLDWQVLVNKRGTTWRKLSDEEKAIGICGNSS